MILYIDNGIRYIGWCILSREGNTYTRHDSGQMDLNDDGIRRLTELFACAKALRCTGVACEQPAGKRDGKDTRIVNAQTMMQGKFRLLAEQAGLRWLGIINPSTAKKALSGNGRASKEQMVQWANILFGLHLTVADEHEADALGGAMAALVGEFVGTRPKKKRRTVPPQVAKKVQKARKLGGLFV